MYHLRKYWIPYIVTILCFSSALLIYIFNNNKAEYRSTQQLNGSKLYEPTPFVQTEMRGHLVTLSPGKYIVGKHIMEGRYKAIHNGEGAHIFIANDREMKVNEIIGKKEGDYVIDSYTFNAEYGDEVKISGKVTFTPVD